MVVLDDILARYSKLKLQQVERDEKLEAIKAAAKTQADAVTAEYGVGLDREVEILRKNIFENHPVHKDVPLEVDYPDFGKVEVRWLPKVIIIDADDLADWLEDHERSNLYERVINFKKAEINKIVEGLNMAELPLPSGVERKTEATLYITLEE